MSEKHPALAVYCPFCGAKPGDPCVAVGAEYPPLAGRALIQPHSNRIRKYEQEAQ